LSRFDRLLSDLDAAGLNKKYEQLMSILIRAERWGQKA